MSSKYRPSKGCKGYVEARDRCAAMVRDWIERTEHQCPRYRVVGDYCKMHARLLAMESATDATDFGRMALPQGGGA